MEDALRAAIYYDRVSNQVGPFNLRSHVHSM